ncbi:Uncharacterised protein [Pseudomonas aeruginosa]|nr:Uncharacterised protein [Pseudomonas aeruginosa]
MYGNEYASRPVVLTYRVRLISRDVYQQDKESL